MLRLENRSRRTYKRLPCNPNCLIKPVDSVSPALIVGVGGFLGAGEKDVAVPFDAVHPTMKDKKWWRVMTTTKDSLKSAPGFKYDSNTP